MRLIELPSLRSLLDVAEHNRMDVFLIINAKVKSFGKGYFHTFDDRSIFVASKNLDLDLESIDPTKPIELTIYRKNTN